jgi:hypothetical protein
VQQYECKHIAAPCAQQMKNQVAYNTQATLMAGNPLAQLLSRNLLQARCSTAE